MINKTDRQINNKIEWESSLQRLLTPIVHFVGVLFDPDEDSLISLWPFSLSPYSLYLSPFHVSFAVSGLSLFLISLLVFFPLISLLLSLLKNLLNFRFVSLAHYSLFSLSLSFFFGTHSLHVFYFIFLHYLFYCSILSL